jgi:hypothetical protein
MIAIVGSLIIPSPCCLTGFVVVWVPVSALHHPFYSFLNSKICVILKARVQSHSGAQVSFKRFSSQEAERSRLGVKGAALQYPVTKMENE